MNIALLHYAAPPIVGGVESVIGHHARLMVEDGQLVQVIAGRGGQMDRRVPFTRLPLADSRHPDILAVKKQLDTGQVPQQFTNLVGALTSELLGTLSGVDLVIAHNVCSLHKNLPLTAALKDISEKRTAPRLILWHHDLAWSTPRYRSELHAGYPWDLLCTDWPGVVQVAVSELRQQELANLLQVPLERILVVPNGVDATQFLKLEDQTRGLIAQLALLKARPLLLLPVRITPRKNIELGLRVLAMLRQEFPQAALLVTGPLGPHNPANREYMTRLLALREELGLAKAAHFLVEMTAEPIPDAVVADLYRLADALFLPSREEGFGIPILEAGLARLPIFCADIPPLRALGDEQTVYFSPEAAPESVAARIIEYLRSDWAFTLAQRVKQAYTWQQVYYSKIKPLLEMIYE